MNNIIGILQGKGGAGRSTVSTNLAGALSSIGPTALIDCDMPQGTSSSWTALRHADGRMGDLVLATARDHRELVSHRERLSSTRKYIIIDAPPRNAEMTRAVLMLASLVIVPVGPSAAEVWATADLLKVVEEARARRPQLRVVLLWNRMRRTRSATEIPDGARDELKVPALKSRLGHRVAYSEVLGRGLTVEEWSDKVARQELKDLVAEVVQLLK